MGFKSHMMATMAKWREHDYLTDTTFHCVRFFFFFTKLQIKIIGIFCQGTYLGDSFHLLS